MEFYLNFPHARDWVKKFVQLCYFFKTLNLTWWFLFTLSGVFCPPKIPRTAVFSHFIPCDKFWRIALLSNDKYLFLLKISYGILRNLNFDWLMRNGIWAHIPLTTNNYARCADFFAIIIADFEGFLWVFSTKQLLHSCLLDMR